MKYKNYVLIPLILLYNFLYSENGSEKNAFKARWLSLGMGLSTESMIESNGSLPSFALGYTDQLRIRIIKCKYTYNNLPASDSKTKKSVWEIGGLYGFSSSTRNIKCSISCGISLVGGNYYEYKTDEFGSSSDVLKNFVTVGFPFEGELDLAPFSRFGIGVNAYGNVNTEINFFGLIFFINIGKLK